MHGAATWGAAPASGSDAVCPLAVVADDGAPAAMTVMPSTGSCRVLTSNTSVTQSNRHVSVHPTRHDPDMGLFAQPPDRVYSRVSPDKTHVKVSLVTKIKMTTGN